MLQKISMTSIFLCLLFLFGCSTETVNDPISATEQYVKHWQNNDFHLMYDSFTNDVKEKYDKEDFITRYEKIFKDLGITDFTILLNDIPKETIDEAIEAQSIHIPIDVSMDSIAGPIQFTHTLKGYLNEHEDEEAVWEFAWDYTYIFPDLMDDESKIHVERMPPRRGDILDRNRMPLAINDGAFEVGIVPNTFVYKDSEINSIAQILGVNASSIEQKVNASWVEDDHFVPIRMISSVEEDKITQLSSIPSVTFRKTSGRHYPMGEAAAHLIGYISKVTAEDLAKEENSHLSEDDFIGKSGLEQIYEKDLRGKEGIKIIIINEFGVEKVLAEKPVEHGKTVALTIDISVQTDLFDAFTESTGAAVAMHPQTGELLGLVSYPSFDPNNFVYGISESRWNELANDKSLPLFNRYTATFAPGSIIKPITAGIGLTDGSITTEEQLTINGLSWSKDDWKNAKITRVTSTDKPVDLLDAMIRSDNIYFAMKSLDIGGKKFVQGLKNFGFTEEIPIDFPVKQSTISNNGQLNDEILLANTSYGQGEIEVSPLHIALMYTAFVNDGNIIKPSILLESKQTEQWKEQVVSAKNATTIRNQLREVVENGTGRLAQDKKIAIAGKTGTAELKLAYDTDGAVNSWFVGFDNDEPDILVAMLFEDTNKESKSATEAAKDVIVSYKK